MFAQPRRPTDKRKSAMVNPYDGFAHGAQGIRQYHKKYEEKKNLPHKRTCYDISKKLRQYHLNFMNARNEYKKTFKCNQYSV